MMFVFSSAVCERWSHGVCSHQMRVSRLVLSTQHVGASGISLTGKVIIDCCSICFSKPDDVRSVFSRL